MYVMLLYEALGAKITILAFFLAFAWCVGGVVDFVIGYVSGSPFRYHPSRSGETVDRTEEDLYVCGGGDISGSDHLVVHSA